MSKVLSLRMVSVILEFLRQLMSSYSRYKASSRSTRKYYEGILNLYSSDQGVKVVLCQSMQARGRLTPDMQIYDPSLSLFAALLPLVELRCRNSHPWLEFPTHYSQIAPCTRYERQSYRYQQYVESSLFSGTGLKNSSSWGQVEFTQAYEEGFRQTEFKLIQESRTFLVSSRTTLPAILQVMAAKNKSWTIISKTLFCFMIIDIDQQRQKGAYTSRLSNSQSLLIFVIRTWDSVSCYLLRFEQFFSQKYDCLISLSIDFFHFSSQVLLEIHCVFLWVDINFGLAFFRTQEAMGQVLHFPIGLGFDVLPLSLHFVDLGFEGLLAGEIICEPEVLDLLFVGLRVRSAALEVKGELQSLSHNSSGVGSQQVCSRV